MGNLPGISYSQLIMSGDMLPIPTICHWAHNYSLVCVGGEHEQLLRTYLTTCEIQFAYIPNKQLQT